MMRNREAVTCMAHHPQSTGRSPLPPSGRDYKRGENKKKKKKEILNKKPFARHVQPSQVDKYVTI